jgi:hypothetical protein
VVRRGQLTADDYKRMAAGEPEPDYPRVHLRLVVEPRDLFIGLHWKHDVRGWDGGWWEGWRFYLVLVPAVVLRLEVDRSNRDTRAYRRWRAAGVVL